MVAPWEEYKKAAEEAPPWEQYQTGVAPSTPSAPALEYRTAPPAWKATASKIYTPILEMGGSILGGVTGFGTGMLTGPAAPVAAPALGVAGAGTGMIGGRKSAEALNTLLGVGVAPEEYHRPYSETFVMGGLGELTGYAGGVALNALMKAHRPSVIAPRFAGEELAIARTPLTPEEVAAQARKERLIAAAQQRTGAVLPTTAQRGSLAEQALERTVTRSNPPLAQRLEFMREEAVRQAGKAVDTAIPVQPKAADEARRAIAEYNAGIRANAAAAENVARTTGLAEREAAEKVLEAQEQAALAKFDDEFKRQYGAALQPAAPGGLTRTEQIGERARAALSEAEAKSAERFRSEEFGYAQPAFREAPPAPEENALTDFLQAERPPLGFSGYTTQTKLERIFGGAEEGGGAVPQLGSLGYDDLREISMAAGRAERQARRSVAENASANAIYFSKLKDAADAAIVDILEESGGKELAKRYNDLNAIYAKQHAAAFRQGDVATKVLAGGREFGGVKMAPGDIPALFADPGSAGDLIRAFGTKAMAERQGAEAIADATTEQIMAAGIKDAAEVVRPFFQGELAQTYNKAGGGAAGLKSVQKWLADGKRAEVLQKYGLYDEFAKTVRSAQETEAAIAKLPKSFANDNSFAVQASKNILKDTLKVEDPYDIYRYLSNAADKKVAVGELMKVSPSPNYRAAVKTLVTDGIKEEIKKSGVNPFAKDATDVASKQMRELLAQFYTGPEIRALRDYHTIVDAAMPTPTKGARSKLTAADDAALVTEAIAATPMGYKGYWIKHGLLTASNWVEKKYVNAMAELLEEALVDPKRAEAFIRAYKTGETGPIRKFVREIHESQSFKTNALKRIPAQVAPTYMDVKAEQAAEARRNYERNPQQETTNALEER